jgi:hypothetical protein
MCEVGDLTRQCGAATPGITKIYLIDVEDVETMEAPDPLTWEIDTITPAAGAYFHDIPFAEQKAGVTDEIADAVGGGFQKAIPLKIPKYSAATNMWVNNIIGARFIAVVADNNEQMIVIGSKTAPMRLEKGTGATGLKFGDENGWDLNLVAEGTAPCYFYTGTVPLAPVIP